MRTKALHSINLPFYKLILFTCLAFLMSGCDSASSDVQKDVRPFPVFNNGGDKQLNPDYDPSVTPLQRLQESRSSVVYGRVLKIEPVLDRFNKVLVDDEWVEQTTCDSDMIEPALHIRLQVEQASWDTKEGEEILLGLHREKMRNPYPILRKDQPLIWSDDYEYFPEGTYLGATGKFNAQGTFVAHIPLFSVDKVGQIELPAATPEEGSLNGYALQDLTQGLKATRQEVYEEVTTAFGPLESACVTE